MTPEDIRLVRNSWQAVADYADALTLRFYERLFAIDANVAKLFEGVDMAAQRTKLTQSIAVVVKGMEKPGRLLPALTALGRRHATHIRLHALSLCPPDANC
jgi:nitric oxide dioxygenase